MGMGPLEATGGRAVKYRTLLLHTQAQKGRKERKLQEPTPPVTLQQLVCGDGGKHGPTAMSCMNMVP